MPYLLFKSVLTFQFVFQVRIDMKHTLAYFVVALSLGISGCGAPAESESTTPPSPTSTADGSGTQTEEAGHGEENGLSDMEKMKVELAKLSPEDAASAMKQHVCPVSGDMLGAMGAPIKVDIDGQQVWICCEGCRDPLLEDPAKYLAKLKN